MFYALRTSGIKSSSISLSSLYMYLIFKLNYFIWNEDTRQLKGNKRRTHTHTHRPVNEIVNKVHLESLFVSFSKELSQKIIFLGLVFIATMKLFFHRTSSSSTTTGAKKKNQQQQWTSVAKNREHSTRGCRAIWEIEEVYACPTNGNHGALRACCILRSRAHWMCLICVRSQAMERATVAALAENGNK